MLQIQFYTKSNCSLCDDAYAYLMMLQKDYPFKLNEIDIYTNDELLEKYQLLIPAVQINETFLTCEEISIEKLEYALKTNF